MPPSVLGDGAGALGMAFGIACALVDARATGRGRVVDAAIVDIVAMLGTLVHWIRANGQIDGAQPSPFHDSPFYDVYVCADGGFISLGAIEPPFYALLLSKLGLADVNPADQYDTAAWPALKERIAALIRTQPQAHWCALLEGSDACFAPVLSLAEAVRHPHNAARGIYQTTSSAPSKRPRPHGSRHSTQPPPRRQRNDCYHPHRPRPPVHPGNDRQLNTTTLIRHAARTHGDQEIVYRTPDGGWDRYTYADCYARVCRSANALRSLGVEPGDRVGILDWNSRRHFELYWSIPGLGAVMLQMNLRLGAEDLGYVVGHSQVSYVCVDESLLPIAESVAANSPQIKGWIVMTDKPLDQIKTTLKPLLHYEDLLAAADPRIDWPEIDETSAYSACYTTGTTGRPKGVYYSHRCIYLHSTGMATNLGMTLSDCVMLITPMFHGQCWGLPQAATLLGDKIVLPGRYAAEDTKPLVDAMIAEGVTVTNGAPAIFQPMLQYIETMPVAGLQQHAHAVRRLRAAAVDDDRFLQTHRCRGGPRLRCHRSHDAGDHEPPQVHASRSA